MRLLTVWLILLLIPASMQAQKGGAFVLRVDDNQVKWTEFDQRVSKYGYEAFLAVHLQLATPDQLNALRSLTSKGYEVGDHTPEHSTLFFTDPDSKKYMGIPGVDHYTYGINRVCLSFDEVDTTDSPSWFPAVVRDGYATAKRVPDSLSSYLGLYCLERNLFFRIINTTSRRDSVVLGLETAWLEPVSPAISGLMRLIPVQLTDVHMTDAAMALLAQRSCQLFSQSSLPAPKVWIQPGGSSPYLQADQVKRIWSGLGYNDGGTYVGQSRKCFNEYDAERERFAMEDDVNLDSTSLKQCEAIISDRAALNCATVGLSHFSSTAQNSPPGSWKSFLDKVDSLLSWCRANAPTSSTTSRRIRGIYRSDD